MKTIFKAVITGLLLYVSAQVYASQSALITAVKDANLTAVINIVPKQFNNTTVIAAQAKKANDSADNLSTGVAATTTIKTRIKNLKKIADYLNRQVTILERQPK